MGKTLLALSLLGMALAAGPGAQAYGTHSHSSGSWSNADLERIKHGTMDSSGGVLALSPEEQAVAEFAKQQLGKPYVWGAEGPQGFDCSGLVTAAIKTDPAIPDNADRLTTKQMAEDLKKHQDALVDCNSAGPGTIVLWPPLQPGSDVGHTAVVMGNGKFIGAQGGQKSGGEIKEGTIADRKDAQCFTNFYLKENKLTAWIEGFGRSFASIMQVVSLWIG
jgi:cell wall-associated NlpC family hydrolase